MTSVSLSRDGLGDYDPEDCAFFDVESARRRLEALVGARGGGVPNSPHDVAEQLQQQQQKQKRNPSVQSTRSSEDRARSGGLSKVTVSAGASIASSPALFDVVEPPPLSVRLPQRPPLTSIERERRIAEMELLKKLGDGDDGAISDLWSLWFAERGPHAEWLLEEADGLIAGGDSRGMVEAERLLRLLVDEHGVYFAEPVYRLATLCFSQGRLDEALFLDKVVLAVKPWHFGALSHIVMVYESLGDSLTARAWARFRLPNLARVGSNKRRAHWAERAMADANHLYHQGEIANAVAFGEPDHVSMNEQAESFENHDDNAWQ